MKSKVKTIVSSLEKMPMILTLTLLFACAYGLYYAIMGAREDSALLLWLWGAVIFGMCASKNFFILERGGTHSFKLGILSVICSIVASNEGFADMGLFFAFIAPILYFWNRAVMLPEISSIAIWTLVIPNAEYLHFLISYPMRFLSSHIAAFILFVFGYDAQASGTLVNIGGTDIAITAACSGIDQLEVMLFVGWIMAVGMQSGFASKTLQFLLILPIVLLVNSLRLAFTLGGYVSFGDVFLSDGVHTWLGLATVAVMAAVFFICGLLIKWALAAPERKTNE